MNSLIKLALAIATCTLLSAAMAAPPNLPRDSVYQLDARLQDQHAQMRYWSSNRGEVRVVTMFYSNCPHACPLIVETIKSVEAALSGDERKRLQIDMISFDAERDTPTRLKTMAAQRGVDDPRWHLYRAAPAEATQLGALLGVRFRKLADGEFNHSSVLILLDSEGRILTRSTQLGSADPKFVSAIRKALAQ
jgi:protein SCO1